MYDAESLLDTVGQQKDGLSLDLKGGEKRNIDLGMYLLDILTA